MKRANYETDIMLLSDQPTTCPLCGRRTAWQERPDGVQEHSCSCGHEFLAEDEKEENAGWVANDVTSAKRLGTLEFQSKGEWHSFEVMELSDRLVFGGMCNVGFLESGFMLTDEENGMRELEAELQAYYDDGPEFAPGLFCNERM